jgi:DNA helicase-2/ATP-dependent DNA helicase PcrA
VAEDFSEIDPDTALALFLEQVALVAGADTVQSSENGSLVNDEKDAVTLITLHAAKGLEFPVVFIVGLEEGVLPHARSLDSQQDLEEERRLAYVGITRAMRQLYLTRAFRRSFYGGNSVYQEASRFLDEIPATLVAATRQRARGGMTVPAGGGRLWDAPTSASPRSARTPDSFPTPYRAPATTAEEQHATAEETPAQPAATAAELAPGDKVLHRLFGEGTVLKISEDRSSTSVDVLFVRAGRKTLDLAFANLQKI